MIKDTSKGTTHYYGDGCKEHTIYDDPNYMKTNKEWEEEFLKAWDTSYGKAIYGELGFQTTDLGSKFEVDKYVVMDYIKELLDKQREEIIKLIEDAHDTSCERCSFYEGDYCGCKTGKIKKEDIINKIKEM